jgi:hypothetical protein
VCRAQGGYVEQIHFCSPVACCFLYNAKDFSAPHIKMRVREIGWGGMDWIDVAQDWE